MNLCEHGNVCVCVRARITYLKTVRVGYTSLEDYQKIIREALGSLLYSVIEPLISFYEFVSSGYRGQKGVEFYYY